ncbi:ATP-binding cassette-type vacuolar membrane transporter Hmt1 [Cryptotrichosporon argae]
MAPSILALLHLATPVLLVLPVLSLLPAPAPASPELPGIRPITIRTVTPRRGLVLLVLVLLAATYALDGLATIVDVATARARGAHPARLNVVAQVVLALGGVAVYGGAAVLAEWRTRWGDKALVVLAALALAAEVPTFVYTVLVEVHADRTDKLFAILHIPPSGLRILHLPLLVALVSNPIVRYAPADEHTGLLAAAAGEAGTASETGEAGSSRAYGTFDAAPGLKPAASGSATGTTTPAANGAGTTTPSGIQKTAVAIPKKLGVKDDKTQGISWRQFWARLYTLSPHLWPSTSVRLQVYCVLCVGLLVVGRLINPSVPLSLGAVVRNLSAARTDPHAPSPWPPFATYISLRAIQGGGLLSFLQNILWVPVQQYADKEMQLLCFTHLLNLSLAFHTKRNTGEVLKIVDRGSAINNLLQTLLFSAAPTLLDIVIAFGVFFWLYGWALALLIAVVMIVYITLSVVLTSYRTKLRRQMIDRDIKQRGIASDTLTNWESVKYFTAEHREVHRFGQAVQEYQQTEAQVMISFNLLNLVQSLIITLGLLSGSLIIAFRVLDGRADAAEFVVFVQYLQQLYAPLDRLGTLYRQLNQNATDAEKLFNLLAQPTEIVDTPGAPDLVVTDGIVEFDDVSFSYPSANGAVHALQHVSFRIGKGQSMALVGESGSGKSTILRLLYRFYDIDAGAIRIDGQDIRTVTQASLRRAIGIVPQDSVLWNDTIGANIAYGKEGAGDDEVIAAARAAKMHERIIGFPEGYATIVGERGIRLSGGEKQRVSLARMFLKSPTILVLDEATSALDTETEREIQKALAELARGRSSLSIAHRLSTIINSDQIVVMRGGRVVENGSYRELVDLDGQFAAMWKKQIFTEAEMVQSAEATEDLVRASPPSTVHEADEDEREAAPEAAEAAEVKADVTEGYAVATEPATDAAVAPEPSVDGEGVPGTTQDSPAAVEQKTTPKPVDVAPVTGDSRDAAGGDIVQPGPSYAAVAAHAVGAEDAAAPAHAADVDTPGPSYAEVAAMPADVDLDAAAESTSDAPSAPTDALETDPPAEPTDATPQASPRTPKTPLAGTGEPKAFPAMPRIASSASQRSGLSAGSGASTPASDGKASDGSPRDAKFDKSKVEGEAKSRKRLSSGFKGFVRRISDQGGGGASRANSGLSRSSSYSAGARGAAPAGASAASTPGAETPNADKKKRFSFQQK